MVTKKEADFIYFNRKVKDNEIVCHVIHKISFYAQAPKIRVTVKHRAATIYR